MGPDYIHDCGRLATGSALKFDSIPKVGEWEDYTGSGNDGNIHMLGLSSKASGKRYAIDKIPEKNIHGKNKETHRLRRHLEYITIGD